MNQQVYEGKPGRAVDILVLLKRHTDEFLSSRDIAEALSITRNNVYDAIAYLRESGYDIEANRREGYKLINIPDLLSPVEIVSGLHTRELGYRVYSYNTVGSTNDLAHDLAKSGFPQGTLVVADSQTRGKGRLGRQWHSPSGKGLYFSLIVRPEIPPDRIAGLSLVTGLAVIRAIKKLSGIETQAKWPNDVLYKSRKLAGVLVEMAAELDRIDYLIIGCGVNVKHLRKDFPFGLQMKATSLKMITKKDISRVNLLQVILKEFESLYDNFIAHGFNYVREELVNCSAIIGKRITLRVGKTKIIGKVTGFDDLGQLVVKSKKGLMSYPGGEVILH